MSRLALYLLGPPCVELNGKGIHVPRRKVVALLAYLAVTGTIHSRDALATLLWPERSQSRARAYLRRALSELNRTLGEGLLTIDRESAGVDPSADLSLDVDVFRCLVAKSETHDHPRTQLCSDCLTALEQAVALYHDDFMAGFTLRDSPEFDEWQFFEREALRGELASALERLVRWHSSEGEYGRAITFARRWLALNPLHEPVHRHLMRLYDQAEQRAAALRQYTECERILQEELGLAPAEATTALYEQIRTRPEAGEELRIMPKRPRHNLPAQTTPFVGRETALAEIAGLLQDPDCRLLTLVGPGGSGKTRLALEAAAFQLDANGYEHGVFFVSLAPLEDPDAIVPTVADALDFRFYGAVGGAPGTPQQQLLSYLRQKNLLLIMDNYEHLLEGVDAVSDILKTAPEVKVLATSRARLNIGGEHRFHVDGMDYPESPKESAVGAQDYSAVKLFLQGAHRAQPGFDLTDANIRDVVEVCRLVEGMPLAIRLAAAWVEMLSPAEIASQIGGSLDLLETERRDVPERQRSMVAVFDHSWNLLSDKQREVLAGLSVFRGGFTHEAAQAVTKASLRDLRALVDRSLLQREIDASAALNTSGRYQMHELLRQYAIEKLNENPTAIQAARNRHCATYTAALERWNAGLMGARELETRKEMEREIENARVAWDWAVAREQVARLDRALDGLCQFLWWSFRYTEGEEACRMASDKLTALTTRDATRLQVRVLAWQALFSQREDPTEAHQLLERSWALLKRPQLADQDTRREQALLHRNSGLLLMNTDLQQARASLTQSLELYGSLDDRWCTASTARFIGQVALTLGTYDEAKRWYQQSLEIQQVLRHPGELGFSFAHLGLIALIQGRFQESIQLLEKAVQKLAEAAHPINLAMGLTFLGVGLVFVGENDQACLRLKGSLTIWDDRGLRAHGLDTLYALALAELSRGGYPNARAFVHELSDLSNETSELTIVYDARSHWLLGMLALAEEVYVEAQKQLAESIAAYREYGLPNERVMALADAAIAACGLGQFEAASQHLQEALQTTIEVQIVLSLVHILPIVGLFLVGVGEPERAVEMYALASRHPYVANSRWFEDVVGKQIAAAAAPLPPKTVAAAQERGRARDLWATGEELLEALK
jgi:predicted ATPase/DNA-binding SARP family transcriptional activator